MIRLLIADDHPILREGIKRIVAKYDDMRVVGEATDGNEAIERSQNPATDVLLLDVSMPGPGFLETLRRVKANRPDLAVLVLSVHPEDQYAIRALRAGASGYLTKDHSPEELAEAIRRIYRGRKYITHSLAERLAAELEPGAPGDERHATLSDREYEVLCKLGSGRSVKEIADELALSPKTVSTYRSRLLQKLDLKSSAEIIRYAVEHELLEQ